jgi:hypothetical protein
MHSATSNVRQGKATLWLLLAVFAVLAVAVAVVWLRAPAQPDVAAGREVADRFLALLRAGKASEAWQSTTAEFKSAEGRETFLKRVKQHPELSKPLAFVSVQTVTVQDSPRAEYLYRAEGAGTVRLLAGNELGTWRIDRLVTE